MGPRREIAEAADQCFLLKLLILYTQSIKPTVKMSSFDKTGCLLAEFDNYENLMFSFLEFKMDVDFSESIYGQNPCLFPFLNIGDAFNNVALSVMSTI